MMAYITKIQKSKFTIIISHSVNLTIMGKDAELNSMYIISL